MSQGYESDVDFAKWECQLTEFPWTRVPSNYELTRDDKADD